MCGYPFLDASHTLRTEILPCFFLNLVISRILQSEKRPIDASQWKYDFATSIVTEVIYYLREIPKFSTNLHSRLFNDVLDTLLPDHNYDARDLLK